MNLELLTARRRPPRLHADRSRHRARHHRHPAADRVPELPGVRRAQQPPVGAGGARGARQRAGEDLPQLQLLHVEHDRRRIRASRAGGLGLPAASTRRRTSGKSKDDRYAICVAATATTFTLTATSQGRNAAGGRRQPDDQRAGRAHLGLEDLVAARRPLVGTGINGGARASRKCSSLPRASRAAARRAPRPRAPAPAARARPARTSMR